MISPGGHGKSPTPLVGFPIHIEETLHLKDMKINILTKTRFDFDISLSLQIACCQRIHTHTHTSHIHMIPVSHKNYS